jgi:hypothetical protein
VPNAEKYIQIIEEKKIIGIMNNYRRELKFWTGI